MSHLLLNLRNLACGYQNQRVVQELNLHLNAGDIGCLLGSSGCGKTTTLRAIAGFEPIHAGEITLAGEVISRPGWTLAPEKRRIGMVFQDYALFPHLSVAENIAFGIRNHPRLDQVVAELLELVNLGALGKRYPHELSGGQQQRVALARALAPEPQLLLLDEPFSNLDGELRRRLSHEVRDILKARGTSAILVTHDQEEAFAVSDHVGVFRRVAWSSGIRLTTCITNLAPLCCQLHWTGVFHSRADDRPRIGAHRTGCSAWQPGISGRQRQRRGCLAAT